MIPVCPNCGNAMDGDGYTRPYVCPNVEDPEADFLEPDANPMFCSDDKEAGGDQ